MAQREIYALCDTDIDGTLPSAAANCARTLGFNATSERLSSGISVLDSYLTEGVLPIVFVNLAPLLGIQAIHAIIVLRIDEHGGEIAVMDPAHPPSGERTWPLSLFQTAWSLARYQSILIAPPIS